MTTTTKAETFTKADMLSRIEKWDIADENDPTNQKYMPLKDFKGVTGNHPNMHPCIAVCFILTLSCVASEERRCTNVFCLLVWILLNIIFFFLAVYCEIH